MGARASRFLGAVDALHPVGNVIELVYYPLGLEDWAGNKAALAEITKGLP